MWTSQRRGNPLFLAGNRTQIKPTSSSEPMCCGNSPGTACYASGRLLVSRNTVELHLSGLTGTASHSDMQKIQIIGFFFENRLHWQFEV